MRKTNRVRIQFDFTLQFDEELDGIPSVGSLGDYNEAIFQVLRRVVKKHKKNISVLPGMRMNINLDFRKK